MDRHDVVVIGGSIAGASLATVLARHHFDVLVLERQHVFGDQAASGHLAPWGVREAAQLDLLGELLGTPSAQVIRRLAVADGETGWDDAERSAIDLTSLLPGVPGGLGIAHPDISDVLLRASTAAGAAVLRGVHDIEVTPGDEPGGDRAVGARVTRARPRPPPGPPPARRAGRAGGSGRSAGRARRRRRQARRPV